jgi:hypothetical protein
MDAFPHASREILMQVVATAGILTVQVIRAEPMVVRQRVRAYFHGWREM